MRLVLAAVFVISMHSVAHAWGADPVPGRPFSPPELTALAKEGLAAVRPDDGFFVDSGHIFYVRTGDAPRYVKGISEVKFVLIYKGKLVALNESGSVGIFMEDKSGGGDGAWYEIGTHTIQLATDGLDLFALTKRKTWAGFGAVEMGVWVYKGSVGELEWVLVPFMIPYPCNNSTCFNTIFIPFVAGRELAFENLNLPNVLSLIDEDGRVLGITNTGKELNLSRSGSN